MECKRHTQKGKCRKGTHTGLKHARWPATTCGFSRLRAFRLAKVLRQSFVGLWVLRQSFVGLLGCRLLVCGRGRLCVCVCVRVCVFWPRVSKRDHKTSQMDQLLKLFRPILGQGGTNEDQKINRKIGTLQKIANTKMDNCKNVIFQTRRGFYQKIDGQTAAGLPFLFFLRVIGK